MTSVIFTIAYLFMWVAGFVVILLLGIFIYDRRYKEKKKGEDHLPKHGFLPTSEVFIDPKDGNRYRVYYNPHTGERDYIRE